MVSGVTLRARGKTLLLLLSMGGLLSGCSAAAHGSRPSNPGDGKVHSIDCYDTPSCRDRAEAYCGSSYQVVDLWENPIPESDLPGLNERSTPTGIVGPSRPVPMQPWSDTWLDEPVSHMGPGFESSEPLAFTELTFVCESGS
jgi:hypothetical protein